MKLIVGLGNPGREYAGTRHNAGWWAIDHLADAWQIEGWKKDGQALVASARVGAERVRLIKPQTYMNLSGAVLIQYRRRPTWDPANLLVIIDDVALPLGTIRLRAQGSAGGHNGLKSIESNIGTRDYARLKIGIRPADPEREIGDLADFVLAPFAKSEAAAVREVLERVRDASEIWVREGVLPAMNKHN
ncbi:MAG TPA: aminoacyl-tRNA hydrolase [Gemmatimonadaceae bacterium]|nr:aminoacyl-tRNA hydrolase [Gemmatimonadaceae bacterium]